jgi:hypothetical protein
MKGNIWQLGVLALVLALLLPAANIALGSAGHNVTETDTVIIDYANDTTVPADGYVLETYDNETVTNSSNVTLTEGTDYDFYTENHSVRWYNTNNTTNGADANVTWTYRAAGEATHTAQIVLGSLGQFIGLLFILVAIGSLLYMTFAGGGW